MSRSRPRADVMLFRMIDDRKPWQRLGMSCLEGGIIGAVMWAALERNLLWAGAGFVFGVVLMGPLMYWDERRERKGEPSQGYPESYPKELRAAEKRWFRQFYVLLIVGGIAGIVIAEALLGEGRGLYGFLVGFAFAVLAARILGRFGGPGDAKWSRVRSEWERDEVGFDIESPFD